MAEPETNKEHLNDMKKRRRNVMKRNSLTLIVVQKTTDSLMESGADISRRFLLHNGDCFSHCLCTLSLRLLQHLDKITKELYSKIEKKICDQQIILTINATLHNIK